MGPMEPTEEYGIGDVVSRRVGGSTLSRKDEPLAYVLLERMQTQNGQLATIIDRLETIHLRIIPHPPAETGKEQASPIRPGLTGMMHDIIDTRERLLERLGKIIDSMSEYV